MTTINLSWTEFLKEAEEFIQISEKLGDNWEIFKKNDNEGNTFLICKKRVQNKMLAKKSEAEEDAIGFIDEIGDGATVNYTEFQSEMLLIEYHIVYSISYQVPVLYLKVQQSDGKMLDLEQIWEIFTTNNGNLNKSRSEMLSVLTQIEHPVLFKPFYAIHPCRTAELLGQTPQSRNKVLTFISLMGPYLQLYLDNRYGIEKNEECV